MVKIEQGDVVQIMPDCKHRRFRKCLAIVQEVGKDGIHVYITIPGYGLVEQAVPNPAIIKHVDLVLIGKAKWVL